MFPLKGRGSLATVASRRGAELMRTPVPTATGPHAGSCDPQMTPEVDQDHEGGLKQGLWGTEIPRVAPFTHVLNSAVSGRNQRILLMFFQ